MALIFLSILIIFYTCLVLLVDVVGDAETPKADEEEEVASETEPQQVIICSAYRSTRLLIKGKENSLF